MWSDVLGLVKARSAHSAAKREPAAPGTTTLPKAGSSAAAAGASPARQAVHRPAAAACPGSAGRKASAGVESGAAGRNAVELAPASTVARKAGNGGAVLAGHAGSRGDGKVASAGKKAREEEGGGERGGKRSKLEGDAA